MRELYPDALFNTCTNGYLLTKEKLDFLHSYGFGISISHDGFEYEDGESYRRSLMSVNGMKEIIDYAIKLFGSKFSFSCTINPETPNSEKKSISLKRNLVIMILLLSLFPSNIMEIILIIEKNSILRMM